jgi:hypothetical protein
VSLRTPVLWLAAIGILGCGQRGSHAPAAEPDAGAEPDAATSASLAGAGAEAGSAAPSAPTLRPQTNVDFASAQRVVPGEVPRLQDERSVDQVDYYVFSGEAGAFYEITTDRGMFMPDNAIALYDVEQRLIARNDDAGIAAGEAIDARLVVRLPRSGDYYVTVEDVWTPATFFGSALPLLFYHFGVRELTEHTAGVAIARDDTAVSVAFEEDPVTGYAHALLLCEGGAQERTFDLAGRAAHALIGSVLATGPNGNGSTLEGGELRVVDDEGSVIAHVDRTRGMFELHPPLDEADYQLRIGAVDEPGDNAFHVIELVLLPDNPEEQADATNGEQSDAEPIVLKGDTRRRGLILLELPAGDEDYFAIDANAGDYVSVVCGGESTGSGVRGLQAELLDDEGVLGSAAETIDANLMIESGIASTGPVYLHLWGDDDAIDPEIRPWVRCGIEVGP